MKVFKAWLILLAILAFASPMSALSSSVQPIECINQAADEIRNADSQTLIVFDVDGTLTYN